MEVEGYMRFKIIAEYSQNHSQSSILASGKWISSIYLLLSLWHDEMISIHNWLSIRNTNSNTTIHLPNVKQRNMHKFKWNENVLTPPSLFIPSQRTTKTLTDVYWKYDRQDPYQPWIQIESTLHPVEMAVSHPTYSTRVPLQIIQSDASAIKVDDIQKRCSLCISALHIFLEFLLMHNKQNFDINS